MAMPDHPDRVLDGGALTKEKLELADGSHFWALTSEGGWFEVYLDESKNFYNLYEVVYEYACSGIGQLKILVNGVDAETANGPSAWLSSMPHKAIGGIHIKCRQTNYALSEPKSKGMLDNIRVFYYTPVDCEIAKYNPPKASAGPTEVKTLRGYSSFQTTKYIGAETTLTLRFESEEAHADFQRNADRPYVLCDDKGIMYRGVMQLGECKWLGRGLYEQEVNFKSPNKLGEGWL
jgi:hypothetical protein